MTDSDIFMIFMSLCPFMWCNNSFGCSLCNRTDVFSVYKMRNFGAVWVEFRRTSSGVSMHVTCLKKPATLVLFLDEMKHGTNFSSMSQY